MRFSPLSPSLANLGETFNVPTYRELQSRLVLELRRARRYEYPLGVVTLGLRSPARIRVEKSNGSAPKSLVEITPSVYGMLGAYLRNTLRETDILSALPEVLAFATFLPGVDRKGAEQALLRFGAGFLGCAGFDLHGGAAAFPLDGLTIEDVLGHACEAWRQAHRPNISLSSKPEYLHG